MTKQNKLSQTRGSSSNLLQSLGLIIKNDPRGFKKAVEDTLCEEVSEEFEEFCKGLELEERDKFWILGGCIERKANSFEEDQEGFTKFLERVYSKYLEIK